MIYVIGIGITGRASLSARPLEIIRSARLLAGGARHLAEFPGFAGVKVQVTADLDGLAKAVGAQAKKGVAAVLATGDPSLYGIADFILKRFGKANVEVIPNVSVVQEAFARIKENANGLYVTSAHGRSGLLTLIDEVRAHDKTAVFTDKVNTPGRIAKALIEAGAGAFDVYVCEAIGTDVERIRKGTLGAVARMRGFHPLNTMILIRKSSSPARSAMRRIGVPDEAFKHRPGMITKEEIRVIALSKMDIRQESVVWDIGSCSGSVAIEAARLATRGNVYAIEKDKVRVGDIKANIKRFGVSNVEVICGIAPAALARGAKGIKDPDVVFVGGGGSGVGGILDYVSRRIKPGGRIVATAITLETAHTVTGFFKRKGWEAETLLVSLSKGRGLCGLTVLAAHNPIFVMSGSRP